MVASQQAQKSQSDKVFTCIDCDVPHDAENLFVLSMRDLAKIKGEDDGPKNAFITPDDLPDFVHCAKCREPGEIYTLAQSIASCQRYHQRRERIRDIGRFRSQTIVTKAEAAELVSCYSCAEVGKETLIARRMARAPGWVGCNILKGRRLNEENMRNPHKNPRLYVTSEDLLKLGKDGFVLCFQCMEIAIPILRKKGRELGVPEDVIVKKIQSQSLVAMLKGVRRVGR